MKTSEPKNTGKIDPKSRTKPTEFDPENGVKQYQTAPIVTKKPKKKNHGNTLPTTNYKYNKRPFGRPSKYRPKYCKMIIDYFTREHTEEYTETHTNRKGETWECSKLRAVPVPLFEGFCGLIGTDMSVLWDWRNNFPDFAKACSHAQALQMAHLATVTGLGLYNSNWAVFMAKNISQWRDKKDVEYSGNVGFNLLLDKITDRAAEAAEDRAYVCGRN